MTFSPSCLRSCASRRKIWKRSSWYVNPKLILFLLPIDEPKNRQFTKIHGFMNNSWIHHFKLLAPYYFTSCTVLCKLSYLLDLRVVDYLGDTHVEGDRLAKPPNLLLVLIEVFVLGIVLYIFVVVFEHLLGITDSLGVEELVWGDAVGNLEVVILNYKNDPIKMMNLRIDTLAQILNSANIRSGK